MKETDFRYCCPWTGWVNNEDDFGSMGIASGFAATESIAAGGAEFLGHLDSGRSGWSLQFAGDDSVRSFGALSSAATSAAVAASSFDRQPSPARSSFAARWNSSASAVRGLQSGHSRHTTKRFSCGPEPLASTELRGLRWTTAGNSGLEGTEPCSGAAPGTARPD